MDENRVIFDRIHEILDSVIIHGTYKEEVIRPALIHWNESVVDFQLTYQIGSYTCLFQINESLISQYLDFKELSTYHILNIFKNELLYIKRMHERGIGSKNYYPFTEKI